MKKTNCSSLSSARFCALLASASLLAFLTASCTEETGEYINGETQEKSYATFTANKNAWKEPPNYTFSYTYSFGDSDVGAEFLTVVTDGTGACTSNCAGDSRKADFHFSSIRALYDYFDGVWKNSLAAGKRSAGEYDCCSAVYKEKDGVLYPHSLSRGIGTLGAEGYGGDSFFIRDISFENRATFLRKKAGWKDETGARSFSYWISYEEGDSSSDTGTIKVTANADGTISYEKERPDHYEEFTGTFGGSGIFEGGALYPSIGAVYDMLDKAWKEEERKTGEFGNYAASVFLTTEETPSGFCPTSFELRSFFTDEYRGFPNDDGGSGKPKAGKESSAHLFVGVRTD